MFIMNQARRIASGQISKKKPQDSLVANYPLSKKQPLLKFAQVIKA